MRHISKLLISTLLPWAAAAAECDPELAFVVRGNAENERIRGAPALEFIGHPVSKFTEQTASAAIHRRLEAGEEVRDVVTMHAPAEQLIRLGTATLVRALPSGAFLVRIRGVEMILGPAGPAAAELIEDCDSAALPPAETYRFTATDLAGTTRCSEIYTSDQGLQISGSLPTDRLLDFLRERIPAMKGAPWYRAFARNPRRWVAMLHSHPVHEAIFAARIQSANGAREAYSVQDAPLGDDDLTTGAKISRALASWRFVMTAVTLSHHEYTVIFENGENVTGKMADSYLKLR